MDKFSLCRKIKYTSDPIHGPIWLSEMAIRIIDTPWFQRLRRLRQLGAVHYIYHSANHTRFEHSIGTYHQAEKLINKIRENVSDDIIHSEMSLVPELSEHYGDGLCILDDYVCELVKIAALCHDIGHGPYSHLYDDYLESKYETKPSKPQFIKHEFRSCMILNKIIKEDDILNKVITDDEIRFMCNLINPTLTHPFIYQIVSNKFNGLDVDKYDYLMRDSYYLSFNAKPNIDMLINHVKIIDGMMIYPEQAIDTIYNLYMTRYRLHRSVYHHKGVLASQEMLTKVMEHMDSLLNISSIDLEHFIDLTDDYIVNATKLLHHTNTSIEIECAYEIIKRLERHDLYTVLDYTIYTDEKMKKIRQFIYQTGLDFKVKIFSIKLVGEGQYPFENIYFYNTKYITESKTFSDIQLNKGNVHSLLPQSQYQTMIFVFSPTMTKFEISQIKKDYTKFMD